MRRKNLRDRIDREEEEQSDYPCSRVISDDSWDGSSGQVASGKRPFPRGSRKSAPLSGNGLKGLIRWGFRDSNSTKILETMGISRRPSLLFCSKLLPALFITFRSPALELEWESFGKVEI